MENVKESFKFELSLYGVEKTEIFHLSEWDIDSEDWVNMDDCSRSSIIEEKLEQWKSQWVEESLEKWLKRHLETSYE